MKRITLIIGIIVLLIVGFVNVLSFSVDFIDTENVQTVNRLIPIELLKNLKFQPQYKNEMFDLSQFNYSGVCAELFQHQRNNKRDLILYAVGFDNEEIWLKMRDTSRQILGMSQAVIPNARRVLLLLSDEPTENFREEMLSFGIEVIKPTQQLPNATAVVQRLFAEKLFLEENKESIDRVVIADFRDVLFFNDIFATFTRDDLMLLMECLALNSHKRCVTLAEKTNFGWMKEGFGNETATQFKEHKETLMNAGLFLGGIEKVIELLSIQIANLNTEKLMLWGQDQATLNYIHLTGQLNHLNFTREYCTQRMCFAEKFTGAYDSERKSVISLPTGCSPIVRHKLVFKTNQFTYP